MRNFAQSEYINEQGHSQPHYIMTRDGFTFLVMGYTGEKAAQFKEAYIEQFNRMEQELYHRQTEREIMNKIRYAVASALSDILSTETVSAESQRKKSNSIDDETLLKAVTELVSATETHSWSGTATELANALNVKDKPNRLTRKLNVLQGRFLEEYHIYYKTGHTHQARYINLIYAPLKLEIKTPLKAAKNG